MDITAIVLCKEIQKINEILNDGRALSQQKRTQLIQRQAALIAQLQAVLA